MGYWSGSGVDSYEEDCYLYCGSCEEHFENVPCTIEGNQGMGNCPNCNEEITFEVD